jgi:uncharacterized protein (TIGR03435 family)
LDDRFKLTVHRDIQAHPVLGLMVGKGGPKLKESTVISGDDKPPKKRICTIRFMDAVRFSLSRYSNIGPLRRSIYA